MAPLFPLFLALLAVWLLLLRGQAVGGVYWPGPQLVASRMGAYTSLELDSDGDPHIAYHDYASRDLCYAARGSGGRWSTEVVDAAGDVGRFASLELSSDGRPCIAYFDLTAGRTKYAEKTGGGWVIESLAEVGCSGAYTSLALDALDRPHVAFIGCTTAADLYYAHRDSSGAWSFETVDSPGEVGLYCSIRLLSGRPMISYYDKTNARLKFAEKDEVGDWKIAVVDPSPRCGIDASLALDPSGTAYISYWDQANGDLKCAFRIGTAWTIETVDPEGYAGYESSMSAVGRPRISYAGATGLRYAERVDGCWRIYKVEEGGSAAGYTSLAIDRAGSPHISYVRLLSQTVEHRQGVESEAAGAPTPQGAARIGDLRDVPDGTWVELAAARLVAGGWPAGWHIESPDRSAGIHLKLPEGCAMPVEGDEIGLVGVVETSLEGERRIQVCDWHTDGYFGPLQPVIISAAQDLAAGVLVKTAGRVSVRDSKPCIGDMELALPTGWPAPAQDDFVVATGILRRTSGGFVLSPRRQEEVTVLEP